MIITVHTPGGVPLHLLVPGNGPFVLASPGQYDLSQAVPGKLTTGGARDPARVGLEDAAGQEQSVAAVSSPSLAPAFLNSEPAPCGMGCAPKTGALATKRVIRTSKRVFDVKPRPSATSCPAYPAG